MRFLYVALSFCFISQTSLAQSTSVLPEGVWSPMISSATIEGLEQTYDRAGTLTTLKAQNSLVLDSATLVNLAPDAQTAINFINSTNPSALGDLLHLGVIEIDVQPTISYYSPILAYGVNKRLTIGVGFPVVTYNNDVSVKHYGSNINSFSPHFTGLDAELTNAFQRMSGIQGEFEQTIAERGYKPLSNRSQSFIGDTIVSARYLLLEQGRTRILSTTNFNLPTGPKPDPDDLLDLETFGKTRIGQSTTLGYRLSPRLSVAGQIGMSFGIPDQIDARVPKNENDLLPDQSTKERVTRIPGITTSFGVGSGYDFTDSLSISAGVAQSISEQTTYSGSKGSRYDLLEGGRSSSSTLNLGISYSTVDSFIKEEALIPFIASYDYSDVYDGLNTERQTTHSITLTLFYK